MNKYDCLLDMMINKILFISERYYYNNNNTSFSKELIFIFSKLSSVLLLLVILKRSLSATVEEEIINDITPLSKNKEIDILKVEAIVYYKLVQDKNNKLFSLIIIKTNKAYLTSRSSRGPYISVNKLYLYRFEIKYKRCYESNISIINKNESYISVKSETNYSIRINSAETLIYNKILVKLFIEYYNFVDVFDRTKANELSSYCLYNYKLEFIDNYNKIELSKSRIYSIFDYKLEQVKKYLNKHLKKRFIVSSHISFVFLVLFAEKSNRELRFYIDYRRLNTIIKRNRYLISLIDKVLARIQSCKYLTRLNIIAIFNKLRIY